MEEVNMIFVNISLGILPIFLLGATACIGKYLAKN